MYSQRRQSNANRPGKNGPRHGAPASGGKPARAKNNRPPKQSRRSKRAVKSSRSNGGRSVVHLSPELSNQHVGCPAHRATPYTVITERVVLNTTTNSSEDRLIVIGPVRNGAGTGLAFRTDRVGLHGLSGSLTSALSQLRSSKLATTSYGGKVRMRLHRLSVSIACDGNAVGAVPAGHIYAGTLNSCFDYSAFTAVSDAISYLQTVNQLHGSTAKRCNSTPMHLVSHPLDKLEWQQFQPLQVEASIGANLQNFEDSLAPIAIIIKRQANPSTIIGGTDYSVGWTITIHCEWCVMFANDPILQATHRCHPTATDGVWDTLSKGAQAASGLVQAAQGPVAAVEQIVERGASIAARLGL